jgi:type VI secretion system protein ImpC
MSAAESAKTDQASVQTTEGAGLLDQLIEAARPDDQITRDRARGAFEEFLAHVVKPGQVVSKNVEVNIKAWINEVDKALSAQLDEIMHAPEFQKLESTWRGLHYLVHQSETGDNLKLRVLNASKRELARDLEKAVEFDQSTLFKKIYEEEYGTLGGQPYGMLMGDYEFSRTAEDVGMLEKMSNLAASAHAPFIAGAGAKMFGMDDFTELSKPRDMTKLFDSPDYAQWKSFRESPDSRYVALAMPRVLARLPYGDNFKRIDEFRYEEQVDGSQHDKYLWMNAAWAYAARVTDAFAKDGWFARTRGVEGGGRVEGLPVHTFPTDDGGVAMKCPTEIAITDRREFELSNLGFLPLLHCKGKDYAAFLGTQSCQKPKTYFDPAANANAELGTKLNFMLCVSRFAHYLKVMARDKIGSFMEVNDCAVWLNNWIQNYVTPNPAAVSEDVKAKQPLAAANIEVQAVPGKPGYYEAVAFLRPHFQMEALTTSMRLVAEVPKKK